MNYNSHSSVLDLLIVKTQLIISLKKPSEDYAL